MDPNSPAPGTELPGSGRTGRFWMGLALVLLLAAGVRLVFGFERLHSLDLQVPAIDAAYHDAWARHLAGLPERLPEGTADASIFDGPSLRPVGYGWFLAGVYRLSGGSIEAALWVQLGLGLLSVGVLYAMVARRAPAWVAALAAGLLGLHFAPLYFEGELHATALFQLLSLAGLWAVMAAWDRPAVWRTGLAGLLLGLAALVRPNALLPAGLLWLFLAVFAWRGAFKTRARLAGAMAAGILLGVLPAGVRNWRAGGEWIGMTATSGINLYLGQGPGADGLIDSDLGELGRFRTCYDYPAVHAALERKLGKTMSPGQVNDWFAAQGRAQVLEAPGRAAGLMLRKAGLLLHPEEIAHNKEVAVERSASPLLGWLPMPFAALLGAVLWGLGGLVAAGRVGRIRSNADRGMRRLLEVHGLWIVGSALSLLPFFAASRYRTPLIPSLLVVVAVGAWYWFARIDNRRVAYGALAVSLALGFGIGALLRPLYAGPFPHRWHLDRAMAAADLGRLDEARAELDQALEAAPLDPAVRNEAAKLALRASRWEDARLGFEAVIAADPRNGGALFNLGWLAQREGRAAAALEYYRRAFAAAPDLNQARLGHAQLVRQLATDPDPRRRDGAAALKAMQAWLGDAVPRAEEWELLGACQAEVGDFAAALESVRRAGEAAGPQAGDSALLRRLESERARYAEQKPLRLAPIQ